ncbi:MAG: hypothetical protein F6K37_14200 [Moorea sp. SIO4E2]|uniref:hypothetical protein n=1 Tax=Moorena sp. SIO4E2 TaxID=2607826 RepID=UPI0013BDC7D6|nr:hypothetical protein [Moorena sp. SIO4E2]NEQ07047.1 hypothetical protein [Moorena sp. SIO4E2]
MFTPQQITTAVAVNACVDPQSAFGKFLGLVTQLQVNPNDLQMEEQDFAGLMEKMIRNAILTDGAVSEAEQPVLDFLDQLQSDPAMQQEMGDNVRSLISGVK